MELTLYKPIRDEDAYHKPILQLKLYLVINAEFWLHYRK